MSVLVEKHFGRRRRQEFQTSYSNRNAFFREGVPKEITTCHPKYSKAWAGTPSGKN